MIKWTQNDFLKKTKAKAKLKQNIAFSIITVSIMWTENGILKEKKHEWTKLWHTVNKALDTPGVDENSFGKDNVYGIMPQLPDFELRKTPSST